MVDAHTMENTFSYGDEDEVYDPVEFDPECSTDHAFIDDEIDRDTLAFRDAVRDIWASEGRFELLLP